MRDPDAFTETELQRIAQVRREREQRTDAQREAVIAHARQVVEAIDSEAPGQA